MFDHKCTFVIAASSGTHYYFECGNEDCGNHMRIPKKWYWRVRPKVQIQIHPRGRMVDIRPGTIQMNRLEQLTGVPKPEIERMFHEAERNHQVAFVWLPYDEVPV